MKEYFIYVDDQATGPFPQDEIEAKLKSGELSQDVLVAEDGAEEWKPAKDVFTVRKGVRLSRKTDAEVDQMRQAREEKLDPDVRKKLMLYGLADAISVDKFSNDQALAAIQIYEKNVARQKYIRIGAGVGAFVVSFGIVFSILQCVKLSGVYRGLFAPVMELFTTAPSEESVKAKQEVDRDIAELERLREEANNAEFKPISGKDPRPTFLQRVEIDGDKKQILSGKIDVSGFVNLVVPTGAKVESVEMFYAPKADKARKTLQEEMELLKLMKTPLWTDEDLRAKIQEELIPLLPDANGAKVQAGKVKESLESVRIDTIQDEPQRLVDFIKREVRVQDNHKRLYLDIEMERLETRQPVMDPVAKIIDAKAEEFRYKEADATFKKLQLLVNSSQNKIEELPKDSPNKTLIINWGLRQMPTFLDRLQTFIISNKLNYSLEARNEAWKGLKEKYAAQLDKDFGIAEDTQFYPLNEDGTFETFRGNSKGTAVRIKVGDESIMLPVPFEVDGAPVVTMETDTKRITPEDVLMQERYKITSKTQVGGDPYFIKGKILARPIEIIRYSPVFDYIEVDKVEPGSKKTKPMILLVEDQDEFAKMEVDQEIPMERLLKMQLFGRKMDTAPASRTRLQKLPAAKAEKLAAKKKAEEEAKAAAEKGEIAPEAKPAEAPEEED